MLGGCVQAGKGEVSSGADATSASGFCDEVCVVVSLSDVGELNFMQVLDKFIIFVFCAFFMGELFLGSSKLGKYSDPIVVVFVFK